MSANKPQPQKGGQKPNKEDKHNKGAQDRDQYGQQAVSKRAETLRISPTISAAAASETSVEVELVRRVVGPVPQPASIPLLLSMARG